MKFSTKAEYGLKAMVNLAQCYPEQKTSGKISQEELISVKYLERLMGKLLKQELIKSTKGKTGGYTLTRKPNDIKIGEIIEVLEGSIAPMKCAGNFCASEHKCPSSVVWVTLGKQIEKTLNKMKLSDLIK